MNLIQGKIVDKKQAMDLVPELYNLITETLSGEPVAADTVITACDSLIRNLDREEMVHCLISGGMDRERAEHKLEEALALLSPETLKQRVRTELDLPQTGAELSLHRKPLGTLFHIAAGNVDALPAYSVIEGLLAGNINILKLPGGADPISVVLLKQLIDCAPELAEYIYVFDFPSTDTDLMKSMAEVSDAIVVWGGTEAVSSIRRLASPNTRIIEWGHKLSFAYVTPDVTDEQLEGIAFNICDTDGLLCSSCQGVYVDTEDIHTAEEIARRLFPLILKQYGQRTLPEQTRICAARTIEMYTESIESAVRQDRLVLRESGHGIVVKKDSCLEPSYGYGNIWVKCLPRGKIIGALRCNKGFLQTAALECGQKEEKELAELLFAAGVDRITDGRNMSRIMAGEPHDGRMPLQEYSRIVMQRFSNRFENDTMTTESEVID